jgi:phosphotransferase system HPr (HPr) family protein
MAEVRLSVLDPAGLHARPAAQFVRTASRFQSDIVLDTGEKSANAKSLIGILGLTIRPGALVSLTADGPDADAALAALLEELGTAVEPADGTTSER